MKLTKQTVYLPVKETNLDENYYLQDLDGEFYLEQEGYFFTPEELNNYMQNVIKQTLETAAEKAKLEDVWGGNTGSEYCDTIVDEKSITNTFEETFNKFKV